MSEQKVMFRAGLKDSLAIVAGFIPACFTFGLVGKGLGLDNLEVFLLSALVFAGASQFIGVKMLAAGAGAPVILLLTLIINLRYLFISLSFGGKLNRNISVLAKTWIGFSLTEEVYAVSIIPNKNAYGQSDHEETTPTLGLPYLLGLQVPPYVANLIATAAGIYLASYIPALYLPALNTSLYALLIALVVPQLKNSLRNIVICISAAGSSWLLNPLLGSSSILVAMLIGMIAGSLFRVQAEAGKRASV
jgi:predicted branched-subunit amino acid permease